VPNSIVVVDFRMIVSEGSGKGMVISDHQILLRVDGVLLQFKHVRY
jgi:hypothetical protein